MLRTREIICAVLVYFSLVQTAAGQSEGITFDLVSGNYVIHFRDDYGNFRIATFIPATKIRPVMRVRFKVEESERTHDGAVRYDYELSNGRESKQGIISIILDPISSVATPTALPASPPPSSSVVQLANIEDQLIAASAYIRSPPQWRQGLGRSIEAAQGYRIWWGYKGPGGLTTGKQARGFGFSSRDLPGVRSGRFRGYAPGSQTMGESIPDPNSDFGKQYEYLLTHNYVEHPVAVPTIPVPVPFDALSVTSELQKHVATWSGMGLVEPSVALTIGDTLQQAIDALKARNQAQAARTLRSLRFTVKSLRPDADADEDAGGEVDETQGRHRKLPMAKLAAKVLSFDVRYIVRKLAPHEREDD